MTQSKRATSLADRPIIPDKVIRVKKQVYDQIYEVLQSQNLSIDNVFNAFDADLSHEISSDELFAGFKHMRLNIGLSDTQ